MKVVVVEYVSVIVDAVVETVEVAVIFEVLVTALGVV